MSYRQLTSEERYMISALRKQGLNQSQIATNLQRHRSTICREFKRNCGRPGHYRPAEAVFMTSGRRSRSRRNQHFCSQQLARVEGLLVEQWSPEQISGFLRKEREFLISHETIYRHVWKDLKRGGTLHSYLRCARKKRRKRYAAYDSRGRLAGKRHISERPARVENRVQLGHWEIDTVMGTGSKHCIVSLVERKSGYVLIGKLTARTQEQTTARTVRLIRKHPERFKTITADNGTEFHDYESIERVTQVPFYFATPYHSWERGTNENTNGLIRQYIPKGVCMKKLDQYQCNAIARKLNRRPRKRLGYKTPEECFYAN
jgi:transposase, IS30 family